MRLCPNCSAELCTFWQYVSSNRNYRVTCGSCLVRLKSNWIAYVNFTAVLVVAISAIMLPTSFHLPKSQDPYFVVRVVLIGLASRLLMYPEYRWNHYVVRDPPGDKRAGHQLPIP